MKKLLLQFLIGLVSVFCLIIYASVHCEIPCGIYDDEMQIKMILEHISTIEKSMNQIMELDKKEHHNSNQLVRWVMNKERHASELQEIVTQYFMTQRIKVGAKDYEKKLGVLHQMLIQSMKCKQTTDLSHVKELRSLTKQFQTLYFERK